jgi:YHS domain-containing protein
MTITEIKKELYKTKPLANFKYIRKGFAYYSCDLEQCKVEFEIPINDMGDSDFLPVMNAQLLNRWILV